MNEYRKKNSNEVLVRFLYITGGVLTALASAVFTMHVLATPTYGAATTNTVLVESTTICDSDT